jgi:hypothetical protein
MNGAGHDRPPFVQTRFIGGGQSRLPVMHTIGGQAAAGGWWDGRAVRIVDDGASPAMLWR